MHTPPNPGRHDPQAGLVYALAAYAWWGFMPLYFKLVARVPPVLVLAHRVVWSFLLLSVLVTGLSRWEELRAILRQRRTLVLLAASTLLLAANWGTFIYAVESNQVLQASLGYFIVPLVTSALGFGVLKEHLRPWQRLALLLAAAGVIVLTYVVGHLPWIALIIACSWSGYSLARKVAIVGPLVGVTIETALLLPLAAIYVLWKTRTTVLSGHDYAMLALSGFVTAIPLLFFTAAARRLRLATIGFLQYITPTGHFLLAVLAFGEKFQAANALGFALIWSALIVYSFDSVRAFQQPPTMAVEV
jgi:chloramphenicol-sensitive protein RarD